MSDTFGVSAAELRADKLPKPTNALRVATFNCENLFSRVRAMNLSENEVGQPYIDKANELNRIFVKPAYSAADKARIVELMGDLNLLGTRPRSAYVEFRKIRGELVKKVPNQDAYEVVATGRADWVGWIDLKRAAVDDVAIFNTARVIAAADADILTLIEVEDRPSLERFQQSLLGPILKATGRQPYPHLMLIEGNDERGIDVALLSRLPILSMRSHVSARSGQSKVFSRDCAEYYIQGPDDKPIVVLANHFTSKGSDPDGMDRRHPQAEYVSRVVDQLKDSGYSRLVVAGDLNDYPTELSLQPLLSREDLTDAVALFANEIDATGERLGTYETGTKQLDYLLMSAELKEKAVSAGIERRGYKSRFWTPFGTVTKTREQASDHHLVWVDLAL